MKNMIFFFFFFVATKIEIIDMIRPIYPIKIPQSKLLFSQKLLKPNFVHLYDTHSGLCLGFKAKEWRSLLLHNLDKNMPVSCDCECRCLWVHSLTRSYDVPGQRSRERSSRAPAGDCPHHPGEVRQEWTGWRTTRRPEDGRFWAISLPW